MSSDGHYAYTPWESRATVAVDTANKKIDSLMHVQSNHLTCQNKVNIVFEMQLYTVDSLQIGAMNVHNRSYITFEMEQRANGTSNMHSWVAYYTER